MGEAIVFYSFGGLALASAFMVVTRRNPVTSALFLVLALFGVAGLFALLAAHFLAVIQILVYAGAIVVLFVFVIMLLNLGDEDMEQFAVEPVPFAVAAGMLAIVAGGLAWAVKDYRLPARPLPEGFGTIDRIGDAMFTTYLVPVEATAMLLLVAVVGAVVLAAKRF